MRTSTDSGVRAVTTADVSALRDLVDADPVTHCFVEARLEAAGPDPGRLAVEMWLYTGNPGCALYMGANVIPVATHPAARAAFAHRLRLTGRRGSSLVGPAEEVLDLWRLIEPSWGPCREVRARQPLMAIGHDSPLSPDDGVRRVRMDELDLLLSACIAMFTEEVGVSPVAGGAHGAYRARIAELIRQGRALARIEDGRVVFKAEVGVVSQRSCQVQGVWVAPECRGRGLAAPGMAAVVRLARRDIAPVVSLYVNDYNTAARKAYLRAGFTEVGTFATVLL